MKIITILLLICVSFTVNAKYVFNKPNIILLDRDKQPVPGVSASNSMLKCAWKVSDLPTGIYYCHQPDMKLKVTNNTSPPPEPEPPKPDPPTPNPPSDPPGDGSATISWIAPTHNTDNTLLTDLAGFKLYYGLDENSLSMTLEVDDPLTTQVTIDDLTEGIYYFSVSAVNESGIESGKTDPVSKVIN